ncbi:hypothetical protein LTR70_001112 [Exophiala xenobiotica]|uniref:Urease accessory protein UreD n=1 Tax=Lithohypha guttulata TaxID=1690604 RepID=A0ABR0KPR2_9EURO|nr:hypothetical protein LTR24_000698 [Lithohypha guttulata]KAK5328958.1 hypothetical protein LTR70_001112 [Exophiala xenobiotica]
MPTKHKRKRDATTDKAQYDLPPTTKARSLPVIVPTKDFLAPAPRKKQKLDDDAGGSGSKRARGKRGAGVVTDDTPKAFARLMAWHTTGRKIGGGLDDGVGRGKKKKGKQEQQKKQQKARKEGEGAGAEDAATSKDAAQGKLTVPKIQPGETLAEYGLRVDQSLPLSSLPKANVNANTSLPADLREKEKKSQKLTRHNKRLARMQTEWRNTEARLRSREEEELEENEEKIEEERLLWEGVKTVGKKGKKRVVEDDPWKELERKRREGEKGRGKIVALTARDHAQAPPELNLNKLNPFKEKMERPVGAGGGAVNGNVIGNGAARKANVRRGDEMDAIRRGHIEAAKRRIRSNRFGVPV